MGLLKLRRIAESDMQRLGVLLAKAKESVATRDEEDELLKLLKEAQRVSEANARTLAELRGIDLPPRPDLRGKTQAKSS
jgi:hypothetical protein